MVEKIGRSTEALTTEFALVVTLASVHASVDNQRVLSCKWFAAKFAVQIKEILEMTIIRELYEVMLPLILAYTRMQGGEMILEIAPLAELATALVTFIRPSALKNNNNIRNQYGHAWMNFSSQGYLYGLACVLSVPHWQRKTCHRSHTDEVVRQRACERDTPKNFCAWRSFDKPDRGKSHPRRFRQEDTLAVGHA